MRTWARRTAGAAMFTASFVAAGAGTTGLAFAGTTSGNNSIGGGNQVSAPVSVPVNVCGNALALLGGAFAGCQGGAWTQGGEGSGGSTTSGNHSIGGGNQVSAPVDAPVNVCGNAAGGWVLAGCQGGAFVTRSDDSASQVTSGNHSIGGGNQVKLPVRIPVNVCGNAVAVLGGAAAGCEGGAWTGGSAASTQPASPGNVWTSSPANVWTRAASTRNVAGQAPLSGAVAGLASLPMITSLAPQLTSPAASAPAPATASQPVQASLLSAAAAPGMGSGSLAGLALGALLSGVAALVAAGRRLSARRAGR